MSPTDSSALLALQATFTGADGVVIDGNDRAANVKLGEWTVCVYESVDRTKWRWGVNLGVQRVRPVSPMSALTETPTGAAEAGRTALHKLITPAARGLGMLGHHDGRARPQPGDTVEIRGDVRGETVWRSGVVVRVGDWIDTGDAIAPLNSQGWRWPVPRPGATTPPERSAKVDELATLYARELRKAADQCEAATHEVQISVALAGMTCATVAADVGVLAKYGPRADVPVQRLAAPANDSPEVPDAVVTPSGGGDLAPVAASGTATATEVTRVELMSDADQRLYRLDPPHASGQYVVVSAVNDYLIHETYIFPADEHGKILDWTELPGSYRGGTNHAEALAGLGYEVTRA